MFTYTLPIHSALTVSALSFECYPFIQFFPFMMQMQEPICSISVMCESSIVIKRLCIKPYQRNADWQKPQQALQNDGKQQKSNHARSHDLVGRRILEIGQLPVTSKLRLWMVLLQMHYVPPAIPSTKKKLKQKIAQRD